MPFIFKQAAKKNRKNRRYESNSDWLIYFAHHFHQSYAPMLRSSHFKNRPGTVSPCHMHTFTCTHKTHSRHCACVRVRRDADIQKAKIATHVCRSHHANQRKGKNNALPHTMCSHFFSLLFFSLRVLFVRSRCYAHSVTRQSESTAASSIGDKFRCAQRHNSSIYWLMAFRLPYRFSVMGFFLSMEILE